MQVIEGGWCSFDAAEINAIPVGEALCDRLIGRRAFILNKKSCPLGYSDPGEVRLEDKTKSMSKSI